MLFNKSSRILYRMIKIITSPHYKIIGKQQNLYLLKNYQRRLYNQRIQFKAFMTTTKARRYLTSRHLIQLLINKVIRFQQMKVRVLKLFRILIRNQIKKIVIKAKTQIRKIFQKFQRTKIQNEFLEREKLKSISKVKLIQNNQKWMMKTN